MVFVPKRMSSKPRERKLKPGRDIAPLSLDELNAVEATVRRMVNDLLPSVKGRAPIQFLKQPQKYDSAMAAKLVELGVHADKQTMHGAVVWHRHYTELEDRPNGLEILYPLSSIEAFEEHGENASAELLKLGPWLNKAKLADPQGAPQSIKRMLHEASMRTSSCELQVDFACHELLATIGTTMKESGARALAWHRFHTLDTPMPSGTPMLPFSVQRTAIDAIVSNRMEVLSTMANADFDPGKLDDELKDTILRHKNCPESVIRLSKERPSVFDVLASAHRYRPDLLEIQKTVLAEVRSGELEGSKGYFECFMRTLPDSDRIIRDLQREAAEKGMADPDSVQVVD